MNHDQTFPKHVRLLTKSDFAGVYQGDTFAADHVLVIRAIANGLDRTRLGLSISRKVGNAVVRNRWKRIIRESFRKQKSQLPVGLDIVVRPRKGAVCQFDGVDQSLNRLIVRLARKLKIPDPGTKA